MAKYKTSNVLLCLDDLKWDYTRHAAVTIIDASKLWTKEKIDWANQKTYLSKEEEILMSDTFKNRKVIEEFSVKVTRDDVINKNYSWAAWQYFDIKIEHVDISAEEFSDRMKNYKNNIWKYFEEGRVLEDIIFNQLNDLKYE